MAFRSRLKKGAIVDIEVLGGHQLSYKGKVIKVGLTEVVLCPQQILSEKAEAHIAGKHFSPPQTIDGVSVDSEQRIVIKKKFIIVWSYLKLSDILDKMSINSENSDVKEYLELLSPYINYYDRDGFCKGNKQRDRKRSPFGHRILSFHTFLHTQCV